MLTQYEAVLDEKNRYGEMYRVEGTLRGVNARNLEVVSIWMMRTEEDGLYRFVTLKPWR